MKRKKIFLSDIQKQKPYHVKKVGIINYVLCYGEDSLESVYGTMGKNTAQEFANAMNVAFQEGILAAFREIDFKIDYKLHDTLQTWEGIML